VSASIKVIIRSYDIMSACLPKDMHLDRKLGQPIPVELVAGTDVGGMFKELPWLGSPLDDTILVFVNGQSATLDHKLREGDIVDLITPAAGG
jgi:molybdopterin converting factor small subunit